MKIAFIGQPEYFRAFYEEDLNEIYDVQEFCTNFTMKEEEFESLIDFNADINVFFRGEFIPNGLLKRLNGIKVALSSEPFPSYINGKLNFTFDSYKRFEAFLNIRDKSYNYVFHYDKSSEMFLKNHGIMISGSFAFPIATMTYKPIALKKKWDVFFIGRSTPYRERFLAPIKHYFNVLHVAHGIHGNDLVPYLNQSRILLNLHADNEISWEPRVQMLMATSNLVFSHTISPNEFFEPNKDYVEIDLEDPFDLYNKVKYYLENEREGKAIAKNGFEKVLKYFDARTRFVQLFQDIQYGKYPEFKIGEKRTHKHLKYYSYIREKIKCK